VAEHVDAAIARGELPGVDNPASPLQGQLLALLLAERAVADEAHARLAAWFASASMGSRRHLEVFHATAPVPEPATVGLMALRLLLIAARRSWRS